MRTLLAALILLSALPAAATDELISRQHYERGKALVKLGDHRGAIREFELAYEANPRPNLLYNIAQQHRILSEAGALEEMRTSLDFFERYLKEKPDAIDKTQVQGYIADLNRRIASAQAAARDTAVQPAAGSARAQPRPRPWDGLPAEAVTPPAPSGDVAPANRGLPTWAWVTIGVGTAVVVGGAVGLGVGLSRWSPGSDLGDSAVRF